MPKLKRRSFLQLIGAASFAPALPALPARAAGATGGVKTSQLLWASLHARAGSTSRFLGLAAKLGVPANAALGVQARLGGARVLAARSLGGMGRAAAPARAPAITSARPKPVTKADFRKLLRSVAKAEPQADMPDQEAQAPAQTNDDPQTP